MSVRSLARRRVGVWLMADGLWTGLWFAGLASSMAGRDAVSVAAIVARRLVLSLVQPGFSPAVSTVSMLVGSFTPSFWPVCVR